MADVFSLTGNISLAVNMTHTVTNDDTSVTSDPLVKTIATAIANGTGNGQADKVFHERRTLAGTAYQSYTTGTTLTLARLNEAITLVTIKAVIIYSTSADNKVLTVGAGVGALTALFGDSGDKVNIKPGGLLVLTAPNTGYSCTDGDGELIVTNAAGGSSTFDIIVIGTSA
jgi:hypothetical protein